ncbi:[NiFe]-hydrogenase assembly chaperone HybE [Methylocystis heyeri]|uniref:[NiFe]-hydrogenase assembly chaperone HybE n=1 Tax=Methylocystis heyeri TaxID=391905 RepID=A0A6B8KD19_9HYPH|nr:[NiFe]-hydrogenase assembly chaperone HybE [Methylocystis heyeri]QGM44360.1 [NiFe]-hydrogenase assembly chaperone HybE [Methylocystis heyeri]
MTKASDFESAVCGAGERLANYYRTASDRMRELPVFNSRLDVEAVGFRPFGEYACGVLVAPWFMNLTICGAGRGALPPVSSGEAAQWRFPAGSASFVAADIEGFGLVHNCSLFSPMDEFADQAAARATATAVLDALFEEARVPTPEASGLDRRAMLFGTRRDARPSP